jgi:hypothetical protein
MGRCGPSGWLEADGLPCGVEGREEGLAGLCSVQMVRRVLATGLWRVHKVLEGVGGGGFVGERDSSVDC